MPKTAELDYNIGETLNRRSVPMTNYELQKLIADMENYLETKVKNETPEESHRILIETGVIDENGEIILRHQKEWYCN